MLWLILTPHTFHLKFFHAWEFEGGPKLAAFENLKDPDAKTGLCCISKSARITGVPSSRLEKAKTEFYLLGRKRDLSSYAALGYTRAVENLSALLDVGIKFRWFTTLNTLKYSRFFSKMIKTNSPLVCPLCFFRYSRCSGLFCHQCSSLH